MGSKARTWTYALVGVAIASAATVRAVDLYDRGDLGGLDTLPIRSVRVGGTLEHVSHRELERVIAPHVAAGFFDVDIRAVARAARTLPWVAGISVRRVWPDSLHIAVIERVAVARWGSSGLVAADGSVFAPGDAGPVDHLPRFDGPPGSSRRLLQARRELSTLLDGIGDGIVALALTTHGIWRVRCASGLEIVLRDGELSRLGELVRLYPPLLGSRADKVAGIDLRYANGFAVRWREEPVPLSQRTTPASKGNQG